jgi:hypothetical protein
MGSGFRVWTAGEVVSASNVNNYLQEQAVMSFAGTAARSSAIASPEEGMLSYLQDSDTYQGYDGAAWVNLGTLSGASDSGLIHIKQVSGTDVSAINVDNCFSATYRNYKVVITGLGSTTNNLHFRLRVGGVDNSTANSYQSQNLNSQSTTNVGSRTTTTFGLIGAMGSSQNSLITLELSDPAQATATAFLSHSHFTVSGNAALDLGAGFHNQTIVYDGITIFPAAGTFTARVQIFGYKD